MKAALRTKKQPNSPWTGPACRPKKATTTLQARLCGVQERFRRQKAAAEQKAATEKIPADHKALLDVRVHLGEPCRVAHGAARSVRCESSISRASSLALRTPF